MALIVNHNMPAAVASRTLGGIYKSLGKSIERLSTGLRINSAADDAAGLAVRELMRADIAAGLQGIRNAADAMSLIQTADGALGVIDSKLLKMRELAAQATNDTYSTVVREMINSEFQAMAAEIDRIANATTFNGVKLLDGSLSALNGGQGLLVHFGVGNTAGEDFYYVNIGDVRATSSTGLNIGGDSQRDIWATGGNPYDPSQIGGGCCGGEFTGLSQVVQTTSAQGFMYAYNWDLYSPGVADNGSALYTVSPDGVARHLAGRYTDPTVNSGGTIGAIIDQINLGTQSRLTIFVSADAAGLVTGAGQYGAFCLGDDETYFFGDRSSASALTGGGGDVKDVFRQVMTRTALGLATAINQSSENFWAIASGSNVIVFSKFAGSGSNSITAGWETSVAAAKQEMAFINAATGTVTATKGQFSLGGEHWAEAVVTPADNGGFSLALVGRDVGDGYDIRVAETSNSTFLTRIPSLNQLIPSLTSTMVEVQDASDGRSNLRSQAAAQTALDTIRDAIIEKDRIRAGLGAVQNRLDATIEALTIQVENTQAAESRISDVDVALEMTEYTKNNILAQAAASMLAQANSLSSLALTLIRG
jgi:flagellin